MTQVLGKGRGMLSIETWVPCRRPGQPRDPNIKPVNIAEMLNNSKPKQTEQNGSEHKVPPPTAPSTANGPVCLVAKYNYKSNPNRPGGFDEMSLTQGERLTFISPHSVNPYWWQAARENGETAYVPATYIMVLEKKVSSLPWLEEKKAGKEQEEKEHNQNGDFGTQEPVFKPYQSAYNKIDSSKTEQPTPSNYYCEVCDKTLNGIKPYQAHMVSKAHKEEVALAELYSS